MKKISLDVWLLIAYVAIVCILFYRFPRAM